MITVATILAAFVTPAFFAAGLALVSIPIIIHILNRRRYKTVQWAAMEFLLRALKKNRRRLKFEQWMLLAVRCLLLALLGAALARPFGCQQSTIASLAGSRAGLHVFVIDNSYSMAYEAGRPDAKTHLEQAKRLSKGLIDRLSAGGESVAIITASRPASAVIAAPSYDLEAAKGSIDRIDQTAGGTDMLGALRRALDIGRAESGQPRKQLYILSDATRSAWESSEAEALKQLGPELGSIYRITHFNLGKTDQWNQATLDLRPSAPLVTTRFPIDFSAFVRGFGSGSGSPTLLQWRLDEQALAGGGPVKLESDTPPQTLSNIPLRTGGPHVVSAVLVTDDRLKVDDARHRVVDVTSELKVLIVEGERGDQGGGSGALLSLALAPPAEASDEGSAKTSSYIAPEVISDLELGNKVLTDYKAVILAGVGQIQPSQADQLALFVKAGGALMLFMGEPVSGENYNAVLLPRQLLPGPLTKRVNAAADQRGYSFDFNAKGRLHPLLQIFAGEENTGLETSQIFTYWQADVRPDSNVERVLDYLPPDGTRRGGSTTRSTGANSAATTVDPAITAHSLGQGRVVFVSTSAANFEWANYTAKPIYLPLMHELLTGSLSASDTWLNLTVGESLVIPSTVKLTAQPVLTDPTKREVIMNQTQTPGGPSAYRSAPLTKPGIYSLATGTATFPVAVNPPADEADVRTLDSAAIRKSLGDVDVALEGDQLPAVDVSSAAHAGDDFGWSFMLVVLALVGVECFMAMRFGHYRRT